MKFEDIKILKFKDYILDYNKTKIHYNVLKEVIKIFDSLNFKKYELCGYMALSINESKAYRTPKDIDFFIYNESDLKFMINNLLLNKFSLDCGVENKKIKNIDNLEFYNQIILKERFAEPEKNKHYPNSFYIKPYSLYQGENFAKDFKNLQLLDYYLIHDCRRIGYLERSSDFLKIKFKYKYANEKNNKKIEIPPCFGIFGFIYSSNESEPNGKYGRPLNSATQITKCYLEGEDSYGGYIFSSEKIDKKDITDNFQYKIGLYKQDFIVSLIHDETDCKIDLHLSDDPAKVNKFNIKKYENLEFKVSSSEDSLKNKFCRKKDMDDFEFFNFKGRMDNPWWKTLQCSQTRI